MDEIKESGESNAEVSGPIRSRSTKHLQSKKKGSIIILKKRITSMLLAVSMLLGVSAQSFAYPEVDIESEISLEIESERNRIYEEVYAQLEAQDALVLLDTCLDILIPQMEASIYQKYNLDISTYGNPTKELYEFPYGGVITYVQKGSSTEVTEVCMIPDDAKTKLAEGAEYTIYNLILAVLGYIPPYGGMLSTAILMKEIMTAPQIQAIKKCNWYTLVLKIADPISGARAAVTMGWEGHPYVTIFPEHETVIDVQVAKKH